MRVLTAQRVNEMSEHEKKEMIENIKTSSLSYQEKEANLRLLQSDNSREKAILKEIQESSADIDDIGGY
jgi:hypothetical protein